ncbi:hypothetical protein ACFQ0I_05575 [Mariniflexile aquimaris]|uniref:Uncharacterized protein n=1 Tax=Mariniflexile aquimaris TaxID=881009 RepID=A0ABW3BR44_9FLAO
MLNSILFTLFEFDQIVRLHAMYEEFFRKFKYLIMNFPKLTTAKVLTKIQAKEIFGGTAEPDGCTQCRVCVTSKKGDTINNNL